MRTRGFSIIPKMMPQGYLRMGYVEVAETDVVRHSLPLNAFLNSFATLFGLSALVHGILIPPLMLVHKVLARWLGWDVG